MRYRLLLDLPFVLASQRSYDRVEPFKDRYTSAVRRCNPVGRFESCSRERLVAGNKSGFWSVNSYEFVVVKRR